MRFVNKNQLLLFKDDSHCPFNTKQKHDGVLKNGLKTEQISLSESLLQNNASASAQFRGLAVQSKTNNLSFKQ